MRPLVDIGRDRGQGERSLDQAFHSLDGIAQRLWKGMPNDDVERGRAGGGEDIWWSVHSGRQHGRVAAPV